MIVLPRSKWALFWQRFFNPPPLVPPRPKEISKRTISPVEFEGMVALTARILSGGLTVTSYHYEIARGQVRKDLAARGISVMKGDEAEASAEAGGWDKI